MKHEDAFVICLFLIKIIDRADVNERVYFVPSFIGYPLGAYRILGSYISTSARYLGTYLLLWVKFFVLGLGNINRYNDLYYLFIIIIPTYIIPIFTSEKLNKYLLIFLNQIILESPLSFKVGYV